MRMGQQFQERQQLRRRQSRHQQPPPHPPRPTICVREISPGKIAPATTLRANAHVNKIISGAPASICIAPASAASAMRPSAFAPRPFHRQHHPRHPAQRRNVVRPHQRMPGQAVEGKDHSRHRCRQSIARPAPRQKIHPHARQKKMPQAENSQRPRQRKHQIEQRQADKASACSIARETAGRNRCSGFHSGNSPRQKHSR